MQHLSLLKILQRFYLISICRAFVIWSVSVVGNLSKNLCPGVGHLSILLEEVKIVHFSIMFTERYAYIDSYRYLYNEYF